MGFVVFLRCLMYNVAYSTWPLKFSQQALSETLVSLIWQSRKKLHIPNQMCQTKLLKFISIFYIRTEKITDNGTAISFSQDSFKDFRRARYAFAGMKSIGIVELQKCQCNDKLKIESLFCKDLQMQVTNMS